MPVVKTDATPYVPSERKLSILRQAVQQCRGCELYKSATQAVFGELESRGSTLHPHAELMLIGEQPGDQEDKEGRPFVGPAGKLLDKSLEQAGFDRREVYVTNAVKHFRWEASGERRVGKKPGMKHVYACRPWLRAELETIKPRLVVCLGATAAQSLLGSEFRITSSHGAVQHVDGFPPILATLHPSAILRARTEEDRQKDKAIFVEDLRKANRILKTGLAGAE